MYNNHYRDISLGSNNVKNNEVPLQVNCAGKEITVAPSCASTQRKDYYLFYMYKGSLHIYAPISATLQSGDMIIFEENIPFCYQNNGNSTHFFVHFTGRNAKKLLADCKFSASTIYSVGQTETVTAKFERIFSAFYTRDSFFDLDLSNKFCDLLITLARNVQKYENPHIHNRTKKLSRSLAYINEHLSEPITLQMLAEQENVSVSRYHTLFKSILHITPTNYITELKLNRACELLENTALNISEIAKRIGYDDQRYFARIFKTKKGVTPTAYRLL